MYQPTALLLLWLAAWVNAEGVATGAGARKLHQNGDEDGGFGVNCDAFSSLNILVTGGSCFGTARADCEIIQSAADDFDSAIRAWFDVGVCDDDSRLDATESISRAIARVWATAFVQVDCDGPGFGCGFSIAGTSGWEDELIQILARVTDFELSKEDVEGFCFQDLENVVREVGVSVERARAEACTDGSTQEDFEAVYVELILDDIFQAFENATSLSCTGIQSTSCPEEEPSAEMPGDDPGTGSGDSEMEASGDSQDINAECPEVVVAQCCGPANTNRRLCICPGCNNPLRRPAVASNDGVARWQDGDGVICACPSS